MKAWIDLSQIEMPSRLASLPKDERGFPIVGFATIINGKPDFRVVDEPKADAAFIRGDCALCMQPMGRFRALVGGPMSIKNGLFNDGPMHRECAEYALKVCPFLAAPKWAYAKDLKSVDGVPLEFTSMMAKERPPTFGLGITRDYLGYGYMPDGSRAIKVKSWEEVIWYQGGKAADVQLTAITPQTLFKVES